MVDKSASLNEILAEIKQRSEVEIQNIQLSASKEIEQIRQQAEREAERIRKEILDKAKAKADQLQKRFTAQTNLEIKRLQLVAQQRLAEAVEEELLAKLLELRTHNTYAKLLKNLIVEGISGLGCKEVLLAGGDRERALLTPEFLEDIQRSLDSKVVLKVNSETLTEPGVVIYSGDKRMRFDNRLSTFCKRLFEDHRLKIMQRFGEKLLREI